MVFNSLVKLKMNLCNDIDEFAFNSKIGPINWSDFTPPTLSYAAASRRANLTLTRGNWQKWS